MYNNLTQQTPFYPQYGYGYQRGAVPGVETQSQNMNPSMPGYQAQFAPQANYIKGRPVVSIDEARASQIDLDGSLYVFPDLNNKKIYTKQINLDGTASFNVFELAAPVEAPQQSSYVTKAELDEILTSFKASLAQTKEPEPGAAPVTRQQVNKNFNL